MGHCTDLTGWPAGALVADAAGMLLPGQDGAPSPAAGLRFRRGAAVHQLRAGVPLTEVQQKLGHARIDRTTLYIKLTSRECRSFADRVEWQDSRSLRAPRGPVGRERRPAKSGSRNHAWRALVGPAAFVRPDDGAVRCTGRLH